MQNYPTELVEVPRPLCFVLSDSRGAGSLGDRFVSALSAAAEMERSPASQLMLQIRYKLVSLNHRFARKKEIDSRQRAPDGCPLEAYPVRGLLKTAWLRNQFLERPAVIIITRRVPSLGTKDLSANLVSHLDTLRSDLLGRDV